MNPASFQTLKSLQQYLPVSVDAMIGQSIDVFHKNPEHQRRILRDPKNLPYKAHIQVGPETLDILVSPVWDNNKNYVGPMLTWSVITEQLAQERALQEANEREQEQTKNLQEGVAQIAQIATTLSGAAEELNSVSSRMSGMADEKLQSN